jgi:hypothetical protein
MFDNADWVKRTEDGANDFTQWGNSGRSEVADTPINDGRDALFIRKADHPIVKGLSGKVKVYNELYSLNFGLPSADADIVASIQEDGMYPTIFVYEKGDKLVDGSAVPNKRIGFFLGQNAPPDFNTTLNFANITTNGQTLLLNALAFAGGNPVGPPIVIGAAAVGGANLSLTWTGGQPPFKVQRRDDVASGAWTDVATTNDRTATVPLTRNAGFFRIAGP